MDGAFVDTPVDELIRKHFRKSDDFNLCDSSDLLNSARLSELWNIIAQFTENCVKLVLADELPTNVTRGATTIENVKLVTTLMTQYLDGNHRRPSGFLSSMESLHSLLLGMDDELICEARPLKHSVARLCEQYWLLGCESAENVILQLIPYLLMQVVCPHKGVAKDSDVKRLYSLRSAIVLLDFGDPSIESIQDLLMHCFNMDIMLKVAEGRRFLSFVFSLDQRLHAPAINVIKCHIATSAVGGVSSSGPDKQLNTTQISAAFGDVLLRAWKDLYSACSSVSGGTDDVAAGSSIRGSSKRSGRTTSTKGAAGLYGFDGMDSGGVFDTSLLDSFEDSILQVLIHDAVHAADLKYFQGLYALLQFFHNEKSFKGVDDMLVKVYSPIIWRSLKCSNAVVRAQATALFCSVFPLRSNNTTAAEDDELMQKHFTMFTSLLKDDDHRVRSSAVTGICSVLNDFWEPIPHSISAAILSYMVYTLSRDASSAIVRVAVIEGLRKLLENCPLSHNTLSQLLPSMKNSLHDTSERVRLEYVLLLKKVKGVRDMHFYDLSPPDQLLQRLVLDCGKTQLSSALTSLLLDNFYPQQVTTVGETMPSNLNALQLERCLKFVEQDVRGAVALYGNLSKHVSIPSTTKFSVNLFMHISSEVDTVLPQIRAALVVAEKATGTNINKVRSSLCEGMIETCDFSIGCVQVLLALICSIKDKLKSSSAAAEHPTWDMFVKYFSAARLERIFSQLNSCIGLTSFKQLATTGDSVGDASRQQLLLSKWIILWALNLQLLSLVIDISPQIRYELSINSTGSSTVKNRRVGKKVGAISTSESAALVEICSASLTLIEKSSILLSAEAFEGVSMLLFSSFVECITSSKFEGYTLTRVAAAFDGENSAVDDSLSLCNAANIMVFILEDCETLLGSNIKPLNYSSKIINLGFPYFSEHSRSRRVQLQGGGANKEFACAVSEILSKCRAKIDDLDAATFPTKEAVAIMKLSVLAVTNAILSLDAPVIELSSIAEKEFHLISSSLASRCLTNSAAGALCVDGMISILGSVGDFILSSSSDTAVDHVVNCTNKWVQVILNSSTTTGEKHVDGLVFQLQRICVCIVSRSGFGNRTTDNSAEFLIAALVRLTCNSNKSSGVLKTVTEMMQMCGTKSNSLIYIYLATLYAAIVHHHPLQTTTRNNDFVDAFVCGVQEELAQLKGQSSSAAASTEELIKNACKSNSDVVKGMQKCSKWFPKYFENSSSEQFCDCIKVLQSSLYI